MGIRNIVVPVCVVMLVIVRRIVIPRQFILLFALFMVYPTFLLLTGVTKGADLAVARSQYQSTVLAFSLIIILSNVSYSFFAQALYSSIALTAFVAILFAVLLSLDIDLFARLIGSLHEDGVGYFGLRGFGESLLPNIYFKSTLFYVPAALFFLCNGRYILYLICVVGLVVAVSKAGMFFVSIGTIFYVFKNRKFSSVLMAGAMLCILYVLVFQSPLIELFSEIQEGNSTTVDVRRGHLTSILQLFSDQPYGFLFGYGLGTEFYSEGAGTYVTNIELDHLNTIRKYGLIWSSAFFGMIFFTAICAIKTPLKEIRILGVCLIVAFVVAGTNPVLISPAFFLIFIATMSANNQYKSKVTIINKSINSKVTHG